MPGNYHKVVKPGKQGYDQNVDNNEPSCFLFENKKIYQPKVVDIKQDPSEK